MLKSEQDRTTQRVKQNLRVTHLDPRGEGEHWTSAMSTTSTYSRRYPRSYFLRLTAQPTSHGSKRSCNQLHLSSSPIHGDRVRVHPSRKRHLPPFKITSNVETVLEEPLIPNCTFVPDDHTTHLCIQLPSIIHELDIFREAATGGAAAW